MSAERPNHVHLQRGEVITGFDFGPVSFVTPVHYTAFGKGHDPRLEVRFVGGARFSFTPETFMQLLCEGKAAMAKLPSWSDCSGALADLGDE